MKIQTLVELNAVTPNLEINADQIEQIQSQVSTFIANTCRQLSVGLPDGTALRIETSTVLGCRVVDDIVKFYQRPFDLMQTCGMAAMKTTPELAGVMLVPIWNVEKYDGPAGLMLRREEDQSHRQSIVTTIQAGEALCKALVTHTQMMVGLVGGLQQAVADTAMSLKE